MKRDWARVLGIGGALVVIQSIVWEYARMKPDNSYRIDPWSHRGFESIHGTIYAVIGIALLVAFLLVAAKASQAPRISLAVVAAMVVAGWAIAFGFTEDHDYTLTGDSIVATFIALGLAAILLLGMRRAIDADLDYNKIRTMLATGGTTAAGVILLGVLVVGLPILLSMTLGLPGLVLVLLLAGLLALFATIGLIEEGRISPGGALPADPTGGIDWAASSLPKRMRRLVKALITLSRRLVALAVLLVVNAIVGRIIGDESTMAAHIGVLLVMLLLGILMSIMKLPSMAANRMLMASTLVAGTAVGFSGGAIRATLVRLQAETAPFIAGEYRDTQVTWGYFLANIGILLVLAGAIMLWARRRDVVQSQQRAAKQRAAAEESARELAAAG